MASDPLGAQVTELLDRARHLHRLGQYREGAATARELRALLDGAHARDRFGLATLPYVAACAIGARCLAELGDPAGALDLIREGRAVTGAGDDVESPLTLDAAAGEALLAAGRVDEAIALLEATVERSRERRVLAPLVSALASLGPGYVAAGRHADAIPPTEEAIVRHGQASLDVDPARAHLTLACARLGLGDVERAEAAGTIALDEAREREARGTEGWALLAGGEIAIRRGDRALAEQRLDEAQEIAEELGMMPLVERCRAALRRAR